MLLPDDDVLYPGHLAAAVDVLERFETVGLAHSAFDLIDAQFACRSGAWRRCDPRSPVKIERRDRALERMMVSDWPICFPRSPIERRAIIEAGGFREEEGPFGDRQLWMRIALDWDFGYMAKPLAGFRVHRETVTGDIGPQQGIATDERAVGLLHEQIRYERRINFLTDAALDAPYDTSAPDTRNAQASRRPRPLRSAVVERHSRTRAGLPASPAAGWLLARRHRASRREKSTYRPPAGRAEVLLGQAGCVETVRSPSSPSLSTTRVLDLKPGELVRVRSASEIFATLDETGALDGLPFMPEMLKYCGRTLPVSAAGRHDLRRERGRATDGQHGSSPEAPMRRLGPRTAARPHACCSGRRRGSNASETRR